MKNRPYPLNVVPSIDNLKELALHCANTYKDRIAFQFERNNETIRINFRCFLDDINGLGTMLYYLGLHDAKIALIGENSYAWILAYFAVVNGGNIIVPLDPEISGDDLSTLLSNAEISCVICSEKYLDKVKKIRNEANNLKFIVLDTDILELALKGKRFIEKGERTFIDYVVHNESCCTILYTSGTMSQPKGVMLSHKNIASDTVASIKNVSFGGTSILVLPLYHAFSFTASVLCVMLSGCTISINKSMKELNSDLIKYQPQNIILVPLIVEGMYKQIWIRAKKQKKDKLLHKLIIISNALLKFRIDLRKVLFSNIHDSFGGKLEFIISGGAHLQNKYVEGFKELGIQILNGYGITECSPVISVNRNHYFREHSVGQVLDGVNIRIVDEEILVQGNVVSMGYYNNKIQTAEAFQNGWFRTGDLGYIDDDGFLYITGRKKNLIVLSNGKNVSPEELEEYLYELSYVTEALVYQKGDHIEAEIYFGDNNTELCRKQLEQDIDILNSHLPTYKNILKVVIRETEFPKTSTKKIRRTRK